MLNQFEFTPEVVKNLIIINVLVLLGCYSYDAVAGGNANWIIGVFYWDSPDFQPFQIVTSIFAHGGLMHLFFNMYGLFLFGSSLERLWGPKRFLFYYISCGIGANLLCQVIDSATVYYFTQTLEPSIAAINNEMMLRKIYTVPSVGASGAIYGLLLAYGMQFPNNVLRLLFPPINIKAKHFVLIFAALELFLSIFNAGGSIGHVAHLSGMLVGLFILLFWRKI